MEKIPLLELVYALRAFPGEVFQENGELNADSDYFGHLHPCELTKLNRLLKLAQLYTHVKQNLKQLKECDRYEMSLVNGIEESVTCYEKDVTVLEKRAEDPFTPLTLFMSLLKYDICLQQLEQLSLHLTQKKLNFNEIINEVLRLCCSGNPLLSSTFKIIFKEYAKVFYDDLWHWIIFGCLRKSNSKAFFIYEEEGIAKLDAANLPSFVSMLVAEKILFIGNCVRLIGNQSCNINNIIVFISKIYSVTDTEISDIYGVECESLYTEMQQFKESLDLDAHFRSFNIFVENVRKICAKFCSEFLLKEGNVTKHLRLIKDFHLFGNESFWICFLSKLEIHSQKAEDNKWKKVISKAMELTLSEHFSAEKADEIQKFFKIESIVIKNNAKLPFIRISYQVPKLVENVLRPESASKYDKIFNFCLHLYKTRVTLNRKWQKCVKQKHSINKGFVLRHRLLLILEHLYFFYKVNLIERLFRQFEHNFEVCADFEAMQMLHHKFILQVLQESLLDISSVEQNFYSLFNLCDKVCSLSDETFPSEIKAIETELKTICRNLYYLFTNIKAYNLSPSLIQLLQQIDGCLKQQK